MQTPTRFQPMGDTSEFPITPGDVSFTPRAPRPIEQEGVKFDEGKLPYHLLPSDAIEEIVKVLDFGARKYSERNWEKGMAWSRCFSAMNRHMWAWWRGENNDPETGLSHLAHAGCCLLFLLAFEIRKRGTNDRPARDAELSTTSDK